LLALIGQCEAAPGAVGIRIAAASENGLAEPGVPTTGLAKNTDGILAKED
jgi:hypothetical protein